MKRLIATAIALVCLMSFIACGSSNNGTPIPTTPSKPAVVVSSVTITAPVDMLKFKESYTFTGTATHSDGSVASVADWRSDTPSVATVDSSGVVRGVSTGSATIIGTHDRHEAGALAA